MTVAVVFQSDRAKTVLKPLRAVGIDAKLNPPNPSTHQKIITDYVGPKVLAWRASGSKVYFRLRGDLWMERNLADHSELTGWLKDYVQFNVLSGVITPDATLANMVAHRPGSVETHVIGLPKAVSEWEQASHASRHLRALTLTNMNYPAKIDPLEEWIGSIDGWLARNGGTWSIAGKGKYADKVASWCRDAYAIDYVGFVDAKEALANANVYLHPTNADIALPNAILEAYASALPVVTNHHDHFQSAPHRRCDANNDLRTELARLSDPTERERIGNALLDYCTRLHSPEYIGEKYKTLLEEEA